MESLDEHVPFFLIRDACNYIIALFGVNKVFHIPATQEEVPLRLLVSTTEELVEYMIVAFVGIAPDDSRLLQEVPVDVGTRDLAGACEFDSNEFTET